jgi:secondary thiamine-phosphate synthase enzyme
MIKTYTIDVQTKKDDQMIDITTIIQEKVKESGIRQGIAYLFVPHTTAAVTINENTDPNVKKDILFSLRQAFPIDKEFLHFEGIIGHW